MVQFLRKKLEKEMEGEAKGGRAGDHVFCYVNSVFAPGLDEGVGGLWKVSGYFSSTLGFCRSGWFGCNLGEREGP